MSNARRLIEIAFPLKQASLDSLHEKSVRHGHISTLHIWPARRPLAASRAALIASLLPDPGSPAERQRLLEKIGGRVIPKRETKKVGGKAVDVLREETLGGILHWGRESSPDMEWFRREIRKAYSGRAPRILDPFAGGGAIPLEAMRLGCEVTAIDINPVAWFILKCTLEYPQKLAGQHRPLPAFAVASPEFMEAFLKGTAAPTKRQLERQLAAVQSQLFPPPDVDLPWHVRAWGYWVLQQARHDLEGLYRPIESEPIVAYLWARTVSCKNCRATVPLLKTRWLCRKDKKRVLLTMTPKTDKSGVEFGIDPDVAVVGGNGAQRREHDRKVGAGTMSRAGVRCPCCMVILTMEDIRLEAKAGRLGALMTAVVVDTPNGKRYRLPVPEEVSAANVRQQVEQTFSEIPFGLVQEHINTGSIRKGGVSITRWGISKWSEVFTSRQLVALGTFLKHTRAAQVAMRDQGYSPHWVEAIGSYLAAILDRLANQSSAVARWNNRGEKVEGTYARFALSLVWDFAELNPLGDTTGGYTSALEWVFLAAGHLFSATASAPTPTVLSQSALAQSVADVDLVLTDPPYYDAIPYADVMDFFYVWLRRSTRGLSESLDRAFSQSLAPKWDHASQDGELIEDESRFGGNRQLAKKAYEDGMAGAFSLCHRSLKPEGRLVVVFANKQADAWETLAGAIVRSGFIVDGSWPIQTEMGTRMRALTTAALSSSVWLICRKRPEDAKVGWDNKVLEEMRVNIHYRLREYWDAGIRGPDFVWAATGPALEAYSKHPVVKKANSPGQILEVAEFLRSVRRIVVDFVVGRVLNPAGDEAAVSGLDDLTTYYLLHRHDFGLEDAPIGPCILYAISCGLSDADLAGEHDVLVRTGGTVIEEDDREEAADEDEPEPEEGTGSKVRLKTWSQRKRKNMGYDGEGRSAPLIDQVHQLMHLWRAGDQVRVDDYLEARALGSNQLFHRVLQALIELSAEGGDERSLLESISNHVAGRRQAQLAQAVGWDIQRGGES